MSGGPGAAAVRVDLRLVPPAVVAWVAALLVVHVPAEVAHAGAVGAVLLVGALVGVLGAAAAVVVGWRPPAGRATSGAAGAGRPAACVALCTATAAAVLVTGAAADAARSPGVLVDAAVEGRVVEVTGRVVSGSARLGDRVRFTVLATAVRADGRWSRVRSPVEVVAADAPVLDAVVHARGSPRPAPPAGDAAVRVRASRLDVTGPPRPTHAWAVRVRDAARQVAAPWPADVRGLLPAVTVGDTSAVPDDLAAAMRTAGLAHVTAVSGAHFAILGTLVLGATAALGAPRGARVAAVAAAGAGLLLVVGPEPSVVRAAVMGGVGLVGLLAGRRAAGTAALAAAVLVLLVVDPWLSVDVGFALSVAATAGLVVLGAPMVERWSGRCGREGAAALAAPVAAQLGCLPVTLALWPTLGPWAVAANVVVAPAVAPATVLGLGAALLAGVWPAAAEVAAAVAGAATWWIAAVARWFATLPAAAVPWWPGPGGVVAALLVVGGTGALVLRRSRAPRDPGGA